MGSPGVATGVLGDGALRRTMAAVTRQADAHQTDAYQLMPIKLMLVIVQYDEHNPLGQQR
jgi:hypothetical protein